MIAYSPDWLVLCRTVDRNERDRLVLFISKLILNKENVVDVLRLVVLLMIDW